MNRRSRRIAAEHTSLPCSSCGRTLPVSEFYVRRQTGIADGQCRSCSTRRKNPRKGLGERKERKDSRRLVEGRDYSCRQCGRDLPSSQFRIRTGKNGSYVDSWCKTCVQRQKATGEKKATRLRVDRRIVEGKIYPCNDCKRELPGSEYSIQKGGKSYEGTCRQCRSAANKAYRNRNHRATDRTDMAYDYCFARQVAGFSDEEAWAWITRAYGEPSEFDMDSIRKQNGVWDWKPDDVAPVPEVIKPEPLTRKQIRRQRHRRAVAA